MSKHSSPWSDLPPSKSRSDAFDPVELVDRAIAANLDSAVFQKIDDRHIKRAANFFEFCVGADFLAMDPAPFPRQVQMGLSFFGEWCPRCSKKGFMEQIGVHTTIMEIRSNIVMLQFGICPVCKVTQTELYLNDELKPYEEFVMCAGQRCIAGDVRIPTNNGLVRADALSANRHPDSFLRLQDVLVHNGKRMTPTTHHYYAGIKQAIKVTMKNGLSLTGSLIHPVRAYDIKSMKFKWKMLSDISVGDLVLTSRGADVWGSSVSLNSDIGSIAKNAKTHNLPSIVTDDVARIFGWLVSNGSYTKDYAVSLSFGDDGLAAIAEATLISVFGPTTKVSKERRNGATHVYVSGRDIVLWLRANGFGTATSETKTVPEWVFRAPKSIVLSFLSGLIDGDGGVYHGWLDYTTVSKSLHDGVRSLLVNLGVTFYTDVFDTPAFGKSRGSKETTVTTSYTIRCKERDSLVRLCGSLVLKHPEKDKIARTNCSLAVASRVVVGAGAAARALLSVLRSDIAKGSYESTLGVTFNSFINIERGSDPQRKTLDLLLECASAWFDHPAYQRLLKLSGVLRRHTLSEVKSITSAGELPLYDIHVPDGHRFLADGVVSHNSGKSALTGMFFVYHLHRVLMLSNPSRFYGLMTSSTLHMTLIALTAGQIQDNIWDPFIIGLIDNSPWFRAYHAFLDDVAKRKGIKPVYNLKETFISYDHKGIVLSYSGADFRKLRGKTRVACVTGDTLVWTKDGLQFIGDMAAGKPEGFSVFECPVLTEDGGKITSAVYRSPKNRVFRIKTLYGYSLTGTTDHPVRTLDGKATRTWTQMKDIKLGDYVVIKRDGLWTTRFWKFQPERYPVVGPHSVYKIPELIDTDLGWFFGIMTAEGNTFYRDQTFGWYGLPTADVEIRDEIVRVTERAFGKAMKVEKLPGEGWRLRTQSPRIAKVLIDAGLTGHSDTKVVPFSILGSPKEVQAAFLRGYFDGDAYGDAREITITSSSSELHRQVHIMLLGFGVIADLTIVKNDGKEYSALRINGSNIEKFNSNIGFTIPRKRSEPTGRRQDGQWDKIPVDASLFESATKPDRIGAFNRRFKTVAGKEHPVAFEFFNHYLTTYSRACLASIAQETVEVVDAVVGSSLTDALNRNDLFYDRVVAIDIGEEETFDFTIPDGHNFVTNGIVSHNTAIDELGWFDAHADGVGVKTSGKGQHDALANSLRTVRSASNVLRKQGKNWVPTGIDCNISSPSSANDMIMRLVRSNSPKTCAFHLPTWDINPNIPYDSIRYLELEDKRAFDRDFRAVPPMADSAFMDDEKQVIRCVDDRRTNALNWNVRREQDPNDNLLETMWIEAQPRFMDKTTPRILGIDPGEANNSFALVVASWDQDKKTVNIDGVLECQPEKRADGSVSRVNFPKMFDSCVGPLLDKFNIKLVVSDHWQSSDLLQRLRSYRATKAESYSLRYEDMLAIKTAWYDGRIRIPKLERSIEDLQRTSEQLEDFTRGLPVLKLLVQAMTVREVGRRIEKPLDGSDDIFRAACLTARYLLDHELNRSFIYSGADRTGTSEGRGLGAVRSYRNQNRTPSSQASNSERKGGVRKSRVDPTGVTTPTRR
jgi:intein/homing endonuclease